MNEGLTEAQAAWLAGYFEGEGSVFRWHNPRRPNNTYVKMTIGIHPKDIEVLRYVVDITGCGYINGPYGDRVVHWNVTKQDQVQWLFNKLKPYLFSRRTQQFNDSGIK